MTSSQLRVKLNGTITFNLALLILAIVQEFQRLAVLGPAAHGGVQAGRGQALQCRSTAGPAHVAP